MCLYIFVNIYINTNTYKLLLYKQDLEAMLVVIILINYGSFPKTLG